MNFQVLTDVSCEAPSWLDVRSHSLQYVQLMVCCYLDTYQLMLCLSGLRRLCSFLLIWKFFWQHQYSVSIKQM